jgi:hypothetical protein
MSIVFIILYTFTAGFALDFEDNYGLNKGETGLCFLAVATGVVLANILVPLQMRDIRHARRHRLRRPEPECNLYTGMFAAPIIPLSLLWMGWTARPSISIWCPLTAALFFGFGILGAVIASYQYITATFEYHTASALATIQATRSTTAGVRAVLAQIMYRDLRESWTLTLLAGIATIFLPLPYLLFKWGSHVRHWSKLAREHEQV